jgi:hypothetical protein
MIYLYFGTEFTNRTFEDLTKYALNWEVSFETARLAFFKKMVDIFSADKEGRCYWDTLFGAKIEKYVEAPGVSVIEYKAPGGMRLPLLVFDSVFVKEEKTHLMIPIDSTTLNYVGQEIENIVEIEFLEFSREKLIKTKSKPILKKC